MIARCKAKASEDSLRVNGLNLKLTPVHRHVQVVAMRLLHMPQVAQQIVRDYKQVIKVQFFRSQASAHF